MQKQSFCFFIFGLIACFSAEKARAQGAYKGGIGDGYAAAEMQITVSPTSSRPNTENRFKLSVSPNPANCTQNVRVALETDFKQTNPQTVWLELWQPNGQNIWRKNLTFAQMQQGFELENLATGTYLLRFQNGQEQTTKHLIIK